MRSILLKISLSLALIFLLSVPAFATTVKVFNLAYVTQSSDPTKAMTSLIQRQFGAESESLKKEEEALQKKVEAFQKQAAALSEKVRNERGQALDKEVRAFQQKSVTFANKLGPVQQKYQTQIIEIVKKAAENYAKAKKIEILLDTSSSVAYAAPASDVSKDMLAEINKLWKQQGSKFK